MVKVGLISDDLTGALDSAVAFAERGLTTRIACTPIDGPISPNAATDVFGINAASRHLTEEEAVASVCAAARSLAPLRPRHWFKKIDSTLRGHVAAEAAGLLAVTGCSRIVVSPAVPSQGRTVHEGIVFVRDTPLSETEFARDAISPAATGPLAGQFGAHGLDVQTGPTPPAADGPRVWIPDATAQEDLDRVAAWALASENSPLLVGAAGLAEAFADAAFGARGQGCAPPPMSDGPVLYLIGSRSSVSIAQADYLEATATDCHCIEAPLGRIPQGTADAILATHGPAHLLVRIPETPRSSDPEQVAAALGRDAACLLRALRKRNRGAAGIVATGGDTAVALLDALGAQTLTVIGELQPGVPVSALDDGASGPVPLITKAGGFGAETLLAEIPALLREWCSSEGRPVCLSGSQSEDISRDIL